MNIATEIQIQRSLDGVSWTTIDTVSPDTVEYYDYSIDCGEEYFYKAVVVNAEESAPSNVDSAETDDGTLVYDTFTDTNGVLLQNHTPDVDVEGGGWSQNDAHGHADVMDIHGNRLAINRPYSNWAVAGIDCGESDVIVESDIWTFVTTTQGSQGLWFRGNGSNRDDGFAFILYDGLALVTRYDNSVAAEYYFDNYSFTDNTMYNLRVEASGSSIVCYINDVEVLNFTDATYSSQTVHGIYTHYTQGGAVGDPLADNFTITAN